MRGPPLWLLATGGLTLLAQVVLLREALVVARGSELALLLGLAAWLGWTALGALASRRALPSPDRVRGLLLALALALPASVAWARACRTVLGEAPGASLPFPTLLAVLALTLLPVGLAGGALFGWSARLLAREGGSLARAYALESLGALAGGVLATALPAAGIAAWHLAVLTGLGAVAAVLYSRGSWRAALPVGLALAAAWTLDRPLQRLDHPDLVRAVDSPYGRVVVEERAGQRVVFVDGALAHESQDAMAWEWAHAAALAHPDPERVLILGGAVQSLATPLSHHAREVVQVEVDGVLATQGGAEDVLIADPRRYLADHGGWDLVLVAAPEPTSGASSRLYTRDFFALAAARLAPGGVLVLRLPGAENHWPPPLVRRTASIHRALGETFADVLLLPGGTTLLIASQVPVERDPQVLAARLSAREVRPRLVSEPWLRWTWTNDRVAQVTALVHAADVAASTDAHPGVYAHTLVHWLSRSHPSLATWTAPRLGWRHVAGAGILLLVLGALGRPRRHLLAASAGGAGMALEGAVILAYQVERGVLFQDLGLLLTAFMAGLAGGAWALDRWTLPWWGGAAVGAGLAALGLATTGLVLAGTVDDLPTALALLAMAGALTAAQFAWAGRGDPHRPGALYAADLAGGAVAALATTLVVVPLAGIAWAAAGAGALALCGALLAARLR